MTRNLYQNFTKYFNYNEGKFVYVFELRFGQPNLLITELFFLALAMPLCLRLFVMWW